MTGFTSYESSTQSGKPVALYLFEWGFTKWRYTSADRDIEWGVDPDSDDLLVWTSLPSFDDGLVQGGSQRSDEEFVLHAPVDIPVVQLFRGTPPSQPVLLTVRYLHMVGGEPDADAPIHWLGRIGNVKRSGLAEAQIVCRTRGAKRAGTVNSWSRGCTRFLYTCGVNKADFAAARTISSVSGNSITVDSPSPSARYFDGGFLEWDADGLGTIERRGIEVETGTATYRLLGRSDGLETGMAVTFYPGCDLLASTCSTKFSNLANHGGLAFMVDESPFEGEALI